MKNEERTAPVRTREGKYYRIDEILPESNWAFSSDEATGAIIEIIREKGNYDSFRFIAIAKLSPQMRELCKRDFTFDIDNYKSTEIGDRTTYL